VTTRSLPPSPNLDQLKRQAKELLRRQPLLGRLRDAQRVIAQQYGFDSWDALRAHVESAGRAARGPIQPDELKSEQGRAVWDAIAASAGEQPPRCGASTNLPDDEPWATPLAWAERRQHREITSILRGHGANR
jgi:hypothetical protein